MDLFHALEPFTELELDCVQNLYVTLLNYHQLEIMYLGAVWPWEFVLDSAGPEPDDMWKKLKIKNTKLVTPDRLGRLYATEIEFYYPATVEEMWEKMRAILPDRPVIVNIDQYYVPFHYPYIYHKKHGLHALMVAGYDSDRRAFYVLDAVPRYKGLMAADEFWEGIKNSFFLWFTTLQFPPRPFQIDQETAYRDFRACLQKIQGYFSARAENRAQRTIIYTPDIIALLQQALEMEEDERLLQELALWCEGSWGWEIDRKAEWLKNYLNMPYTRSLLPGGESYGSLTNLIDEINREWKLAYRLLFKGVQGAEVRNTPTKALAKMCSAREKESELLNLLVNQ